MDDVLQRALSAVELREAELLSWGAVGAQWQRDELLAVLGQFGDGELLLGRMCELALIVETPSGGFRTRSAETIRMLATLRQAFRQESVSSGRPLVLDYRFLHRPRRRPRRDVPRANLESILGQSLGPNGLACVQTLAPECLSGFQMRSSRDVLEALTSGRSDRGLVVTAGTGSGKTLAFFLPVLAWLCEQPPSPNGVLALALYPRNELLKDQLKVLVSYALRLHRAGLPAVSLGTWFGPTPHNASLIAKGKIKTWRPVSGGFVCPYLQCPNSDCDDGDMIWPTAKVSSGEEVLKCVACGTVVPGEVLRLTRDSSRKYPPRVMLSTTESLNRQLSSPANLSAFGVVHEGLRTVLLDEIHTYEGTTGAQNAYLFRRLREALGREPLWAGLSATLADPAEFFGRLVNLETDRVLVVEPDASELEESGAEYLVALRHNPYGNTGTLSTTIQTAMALSRALDPMRGDPFDPPVDSGGVFGNRMFAFADEMDTTNRLYWDLLDAEGWAWPGAVKRGVNPLTLAHLRSGSQARLPLTHRESPIARDQDGQYWWLSEHLGHGLEGDVQKYIGRTSSQDSGVSAEADVVVATASLEVGFDDDRVGAVLQHKAPHDVAQFLQRKGRAGRNATTRPWTVVVLSGWGRDREAWDSYDALFSPVVPPRFLPLDNLYVLRIQAVYSLLDWLARRLNYGRASTWSDSAGPADLLSPDPKWQADIEKRQGRLELLLGSLLRDGPERSSLIRHLRRSLALGIGPAGDAVIDKILWEAPRPLLTAVVPTLRRRLRDEWAGERPAADDSGLRTKTPLRDFVPGNLFEELLVPDVEFHVPWSRDETRVEHLPALRAIREFLPGNVSRHFGVSASHKRHWLPLEGERSSDGEYLIDVSVLGGMPIDAVELPDRKITLFSPSRVELESVPEDVSDASSMRADWEFSGTPLGSGTSLPLSGALSDLFGKVDAHLHSQGGGVRVVRYATTARGGTWRGGRHTTAQLRFGTRLRSGWEPAALGVEIHCDALHGLVKVPEIMPEPSPQERVAWMRNLIERGDQLPEDLSFFDRSALADCVEALAVGWDWSNGAPNERSFVSEVGRIANLMTEPDQAGSSSLVDLLEDSDVTEPLLECLLSARESSRSLEWQTWSKRQFTLAAANALLVSMASGNSHVDTEELLVDPDPSDPSGFFISEQSPGGLGQIESLAVSLIESPEDLPFAFSDVLRPTDLELLDVQLRSVIETTDANLATAVTELANSWPMGHDAVRRSTENLDVALNQAGVTLGHPARVAMSTRLAGPGSSTDLIREFGYWLEERDERETASGLEVSPRSLAVILADRAQADSYLHLEDPGESRRYRAIANVLWPWGLSLNPGSLHNPYSPHDGGSVELLRRVWVSPVGVLQLDHWDDDTRKVVHQALRDAGDLVIRVPSASKRLLREAILDLQTIPLEVGPVWSYPQVKSLQDRGPHIEARLLLKESW